MARTDVVTWLASNHFPMRDEMDDGCRKGHFYEPSQIGSSILGIGTSPRLPTEGSIRELLTVTGNDFNFDLLPGVI